MWAGTFGVWRDHVLKHKRRVKLKLNRGPKLNSRIVLRRHRVVPSNYWLPAQSVTLPAIRKPWRDLLSTLIWHSFFRKLFDTFAEKFLHPFSWPAPDLMCQLTNKVSSYFFGFGLKCLLPAAAQDTSCVNRCLRVQRWLWIKPRSLCVPLELEPLLHPHNLSASPFCVHLSFFKVTAVSRHLHTHTHTNTRSKLHIHTLLGSVTAFLAWIAV